MAQLIQEDAWLADWNNIVRNIIFKDEVMKDLMTLPAKTTVVDFVTRYFIKDGTVSEILKDEKVRIVYSMVTMNSLSEKAGRNILSFEIYVNDKYQHNYSRDFITSRAELIALRLRQLLLKNRYNGVYRFYEPSEGYMTTSTVGYSRYNLSLKYTRIF